MCLLLLNEIKQEATVLSCSMPETWLFDYSTVEVRSPSLYNFVAMKCGKLDTVMTQCKHKLGVLLIRSFALTVLSRSQQWIEATSLDDCHPDWLSKYYLKILGYLSKLRILVAPVVGRVPGLCHVPTMVNMAMQDWEPWQCMPHERGYGLRGVRF